MAIGIRHLQTKPPTQIPTPPPQPVLLYGYGNNELRFMSASQKFAVTNLKNILNRANYKSVENKLDRTCQMYRLMAELCIYQTDAYPVERNMAKIDGRFAHSWEHKENSQPETPTHTRTPTHACMDVHTHTRTHAHPRTKARTHISLLSEKDSKLLPHWAISRTSQCSTTGVTKAVVCVILSVGWCI